MTDVQQNGKGIIPVLASVAHPHIEARRAGLKRVRRGANLKRHLRAEKHALLVD